MLCIYYSFVFKICIYFIDRFCTYGLFGFYDDFYYFALCYTVICVMFALMMVALAIGCLSGRALTYGFCHLERDERLKWRTTLAHGQSTEQYVR